MTNIVPKQASCLLIFLNVDQKRFVHVDVGLHLLQEWYDGTSEAGPKQRPRSDTSTERPSLKVLAFDQGRLSILDAIPVEFFIALHCKSFFFVFFQDNSIILMSNKTRIPPVVLDTHGSSQASALEAEIKQVDTWNGQYGSRETPGRTEGPSPSTGGDRTGCRPEYDADGFPIDPYKYFAFREDSIMPLSKLEGDFEFPG